MLTTTKAIRIAIFNGLDYHYEIWGPILNWYSVTQDVSVPVDIYSVTHLSMGWFEVYAKCFPALTLNYLPPRTYYAEKFRAYDLVFLPTMMDSFFNHSVLKRSTTTKRIIATPHRPWDKINNMRNIVHLRYMPEWPDNKWAFPIWDLSTFDAKSLISDLPIIDKSVINVYLADGGNISYNSKALNEFAKQDNVHFQVVGRRKSKAWFDDVIPADHLHRNYQVPAATLIYIMQNCDYFFYGLDDDPLFHEQMISGHLSLALCCSTPLICEERTMTALKLESAAVVSYKDSYPVLVKNTVNLKTAATIEMKKSIEQYKTIVDDVVTQNEDNNDPVVTGDADVEWMMWLFSIIILVVILGAVMRAGRRML